MPAQPKVSVIIPLYNGAATIDDGAGGPRTSRPSRISRSSSSTTARRTTASRCWTELAKKYPFRLIEFPENRGVSKARNAGAAAARGEILLFIDADCIVLPETIEPLRRGAAEGRQHPRRRRLYPRRLGQGLLQQLPVALYPSCGDQDRASGLHRHPLHGHLEEDLRRVRRLQGRLFHRPRRQRRGRGAVPPADRRPATSCRGPATSWCSTYSASTSSKSVRNAIKKSKYWTMYSLYNKDVTAGFGRRLLRTQGECGHAGDKPAAWWRWRSSLQSWYAAGGRRLSCTASTPPSASSSCA